MKRKIKKTIKILFFAIVLGAIIWAGWSLFENKESTELETQTENTQVKITTTEIPVKEETDKYSIDMKYPQFTGGENVESANLAIKNKIDELVNGFKKDVVENALPDFDFKSSLNNVYEIGFLTNDIISIKFNTLEYVAGMAHPSNYEDGFSYDLKNNKEITFSDLFNPGINYLSLLSGLSRDILKTQMASSDYYSEDMVNSGTEPKDYNFSEFVITKDLLIVIFNPAQVAPYVAGIQYADISWDKMAQSNNKSDIIKLITK